MKKMKIMLSVLALVGALCFAFAGKPANPGTLNPQTSFSYEDLKIPPNKFDGTRPNAITHYDCPGNGALCARAYDLGHVGDPAHRRADQDVKFR